MKVILFFVDLNLLQARKLDIKLVVRIFCLTVHRFVARVQSPTCTTYRKFLLKSIMAVLTQKLSVCYICNKTNVGYHRPYIDSPKWIKNKKATVNPNNNNDNCFQYAMMLALNHEQIKKNLQKTTRVYPFMDQYEWKDVIFPSHTKGWKNFEKCFVHPT